MQYRHRFDVLSIALLMTTQLSAVAFTGRAPDWLVRTDPRRRHVTGGQARYRVTGKHYMCFFSKDVGFLGFLCI